MNPTMVEVRGLSMNFSGLQALNDVNFDVEEGTITGIIGPNGAGKTTLFNVLTGNFKPTGGRITFQGQEITGLPSNKICRLGISRTYQNSRPFHALSVLNNVKVAMLYGRARRKGKGSSVDREIPEILEFMHLADSADKRAEDLIPLDRKRLEIARALATLPKLLLLDEVIAGLTPKEILAMMETIRAIQQRGVTVLLIEHVMKAVMGLSGKIVVLHHGVKIAEGDPTSVSQDQNVIEAYLGSEY